MLSTAVTTTKRGVFRTDRLKHTKGYWIFQEITIIYQEDSVVITAEVKNQRIE